MTTTKQAVAIDLGAGSCRASLAQWDGSTAKVQLAHRFTNGPVERREHLYWDLDRLLAGIDEGLRLCAQQLPSADNTIHSVGVTGWAVDYVRLDSAGKPLGDPFCYRDPRTENAMAEVWERIPRERLYELTGIQFLRFNTLYQLHADRRDGLTSGARWLNIPEYCLFRLAGGVPEVAVSEYTNSTHTQLLGVRTRQWCDEIFTRVGLDRSAAPRVVPPGTQLGALQGAPAQLPAYRGAQVIAPACHDTGAAVAGIPDSGRDWTFISSGTWSLVGAVLDEPCTSSAALDNNFTNEGGVGGTIRFLKNVNGLWLLEECMRAWEVAEGRRWKLPELLSACQARPDSKAIFNVDMPDLLLPGHMPAKINRALQQAGRAPIPEDPEHAPEMAGAIFASLAARYADILQTLQEVVGRRFRRVYVVGGGSQNAILNRLLAEATGFEVTRGPVESATAGNLAVQFAALESGGGVDANAVATWAERLGRAMSK